MLVYYNSEQETTLKELQEVHERVSKKQITFQIEALTNALRDNPEYISHVQVGRDGLLGSLRRIEWAYNEHLRVDFDQKGHDLREAFVQTFFHNAKCFVEIFRRCFSQIPINQKNKEVFREITTIRNFFAHSYEKDVLDNKTFVRININHHFNDGLFELEIFDLESGDKIQGLYFSLSYFFNEINELLKKIIRHITLKSK